MCAEFRCAYDSSAKIQNGGALMSRVITQQVVILSMSKKKKKKKRQNALFRERRVSMAKIFVTDLYSGLSYFMIPVVICYYEK